MEDDSLVARVSKMGTAIENIKEDLRKKEEAQIERERAARQKNLGVAMIVATVATLLVQIIVWLFPQTPQP